MLSMGRPKLDMEPALASAQEAVAQQPAFEKRKKYSIWLLPSIYKAVQHEAIDRDMSVGEIFEEAMHARVMLIDKGEKKDG